MPTDVAIAFAASIAKNIVCQPGQKENENDKF